MDLDLAQERGLWPLSNQGGDPVVIENNKDYEGSSNGCVCVCLFSSSSRGGLPSDAGLTARQIPPPPHLQRHSPVSHPISLPLWRC